MALDPINCTTHARDIEEQYLKVVRGTDPDTTWMIISPNSAKEYFPEHTGADFAEFLQSFEDTKVQFGLARVNPPGSDVEKLLLVGWCPDSSPMKTRASFAANFAVVANQVLQGYHVQVTARDEDDLDEQDLLKQISNAAGARYSIQAESGKPKPKPTPTMKKPSATKSSAAAAPPPRPIPSPEPKSNDNDDDWDEPQVEERDLSENPLKPNESSYKPVGKVDLQKIIAEENAREDPRLVSTSNAGSKIDPTSDIANLKAKSKQLRDTEINNFLKHKNDHQHDDKVIKGFKNGKSPAQLWAEKKSQENKTQEESPKQSEASFEEQPEEEEEEEHDISDLKSKFENLASTTEASIIKPQPVSRTSISPSETNNAFSQASKNPKKFGMPLPGMHTEDSEKEEEQNNDDDEWDEDEAPPTLPSRNVEEPVPENEPEAPQLPSRQKSMEHVSEDETGKQQHEQQEEQEEQEEETPQLPPRNESTAVPPPPPRRSVEPAKPASKFALAEYDYEAAEDNELTFEEGDKIINIDFVDTDWWLGELEKNGEKGLFPSNYVSLQN